MYYIGIDFGHGETTVSRVPGYNGNPVSQVALRNANDAADKKIISAVCIKNDKWSLVYSPSDYAAKDLREGFKAMVNTGDGRTDIKCMSERDKESMKEFAKLIFKTILEQDSDLIYNQESNEKNFELGIACPSDWTRIDPNSQQKYLDFFRNECGLPVDHCIKESDAAFFSKFSRYTKDDCVFVIDLGSSTIDFTTYSGGKCITSCCWGENQGAHKIDDALVSAIRQTGNNAENVNKLNNHRQQIGWGDCYAAISLHARKAKELFYSKNQDDEPEFSIGVPFADLTLKWPGGPWDYCIGFRAPNKEYNKLVENYMLGIHEILKNAKIKLNQNGIFPNRILLSGGACRMNFVQKYAKEIFQEAKVDIDQQPECVVSNGIALFAKAQAEAEGGVVNPLSAINYADLYIQADREATLKATETLFSSVLTEINGSSDLTGMEMYQKIAEFFLGLNSSNEEYKKILNKRINDYINEKVAFHIKDAVKKVFNHDINPADVNVKVEVQVMTYNPEFFIEGNGGKVIVEILEKATGPHIFTPFDINRPRSSYERSIVAQKCREKLCAGDPFNVGYDSDDLSSVANEIKTKCISEARKILYNNQLFETTFKQ